MRHLPMRQAGIMPRALEYEAGTAGITSEVEMMAGDGDDGIWGGRWNGGRWLCGVNGFDEVVRDDGVRVRRQLRVAAQTDGAQSSSSCLLRCWISRPAQPALVPDIFFERIAAHTRVLRSMLLDWVAGEHLLLVGNQGVGKNRISDELLILMQREREYIQLHRDTTVQTLTLSPALEQGDLFGMIHRWFGHLCMVVSLSLMRQIRRPQR